MALYFPCVSANPSANFGFRNRRHFRGNNKKRPPSAGSSFVPLPRPTFFHQFEQFHSQATFDSREIYRDRWRARKRSIFFCASSKSPLDKCTYRCVVSRSACPHLCRAFAPHAVRHSGELTLQSSLS